MKRKFTLLIAALALLTMIVQPGRAWGQNRDSYSYTFTAKVFDANNQTKTLNSVDWTFSGTGGDYFNYDGTKGQQFGSGNKPYSAFTLSTSGISGTITEIKVNTSGANNIAGTLNVTVGGNAFGNQYTLTNSATEATFSGSALGDIVFNYAQTSSKAIYIKSITVTYNTGGGSDPSISADDVNIAYDATSGSIIYEIENYVAGTMTANTTADWISGFTYQQVDEIGEVGFTTTANESVSPRSATVTLTYTYGTKSTVNKNVTVTQAGNPNASGGANNPYTVAEARAAIDAGTGTQGVYATGIVYQVDSYNSTYHSITYWISDDGTSTNPLEVYGGLGIDDETNQFNSKDDIQVNDIVVVRGNLIKYNTTYEFAQNNRLISLVRKVATPTFYPAAGAVALNTEITISCATDEATIYYTTDGSDPTTNSSVYSDPIIIDAAKTIKAFAVKDNYTNSEIATATYTILAPAATPTFSPAAGTYTWAQSVTISTTTEGATIYYTTNGDNPTTGSTEYTAAIPVNATTTIKAIAAKEGLANSTVAEATYTMNIPAINASNVNLAYDATAGSIAYTMTNPVDGGVLTAAITGGNEGSWLTLGAVSAEAVVLTCSANDGNADRDATVTLTYTYNTDKTVTKVVTVTQAHFVVDYATLPFAFDGGRADIANTVGLTQENLGTDYGSSPKLKFEKGNKDNDGLYSTLVLKINETPGILTFDIKGNSFSGSTFKVQTSADGVNYTDLATYTELSDKQSESFDNIAASVRYIKWIYTQKVAGNVALGNIALDAPDTNPSITINPGPYNLNANGGDAELPVTYTNMPNDPQAEVIFYESNGETPLVENPTWITATINNAGNVDGHIDANTGAARSAYFKVKGIDANDNAVYSDLVTINQAAYVLSIEFETASIDLAAGGESDRKLSFEYSGLGNDPEFSVNRYESDGTTPATYDWLTTEITDGNKVSITVTANTGAARTAYFKVYGSGSVASTESNLVTVNQAAAAQEVTYTLITDINDLTPGYHYLIASEATLDKLDIMDEQKSNNRGAKSVDVNNGTITLTNDYYDFVISGYENHWTIYDESYNQGNGGFLYAASSGSNYLKTRAANSDGNSEWSIAIDNEGVATLVAQGNYTRNTMQYNSSSSIFACYSSASQSDVYLYKKTTDTPVYYSPTEITVNNPNTSTDHITVQNNEILTLTGDVTATDPANLIIEDGGQVIVNNTGVQATFKKSVAHGGAKDAANWYTISSPVNNIATASVNNLIQDPATKYDLYYYDEATQMWKNHKANAITNMTNGRGYLYWNTDGDELSFPGELNSGNVEITVTTTGTGDLAGFNLIGNPYSHNIYKGDGTAIPNSILSAGYYTLSNAGAWTAGTDNTTAIKPGQGILVKATAAGTVTMTNTTANGAKRNNEFIKFMIANSQYEDVAYALFNDEEGLNKINHRNASIPMLYIAQNDENYAIATMSEETQSFNLNFKAMTTGQYTLSYKAEGNYDYLHVIDRLTGEDIDMLLDGEYSFIASPSDNDARFIVKLGYNTNNSAENDIFAYQNNSDIVVNGEGELQVFDVTGRMVATQHVNGVQTVNVPSQGVFIFKLNEKTQKIVVR